jgi:Transposase DDE domain
MHEETEFKNCFEKLFHSKKEATHFNFDSYDWGCLQYMLELWFFLNKRRTEGINSTSSFFSFILSWLTAKEELRKYDGKDFTVASMLTFLLFTKLTRRNIEDALEFLSSNKMWMNRLGFETVPSKGAVTKFKDRMADDFNLFFSELINHITELIDFHDLQRFHVTLFTKCYFGNRRYPRGSKEMEQLKFTQVDKKIHHAATKWAGFNLMLYVIYGLGFVNILGDMKVEKRSNCIYTPLQISLSIIVKIILGFKNAYSLDEELEDDIFLQMICTLDGDKTPGKNTLNNDIKRYKEEELRKAYQTIIQWMRLLGLVAGETVAADASKITVDGKTYEGSEKVYDHQTKQNVTGYKLFVIYDVIYRIPIYFEIRGINEADSPKLQELVKNAMEWTGKKIKKIYIDRGFYDEDNFMWLNQEKRNIKYVTRGKAGTDFFKQAAKLSDDKFSEVLLKTNDYEPKTTRGEASKKKRDENKKPVKIAEYDSSFSDGSKVRVVAVKKNMKLSKTDKLFMLLEKLSGLYKASEIFDLYQKEFSEVYSESKNPGISIKNSLNKISGVEVVGKGKGTKFKIEGFKSDLKLIGEKEKEEMYIWMTNDFEMSPAQVVEDYGNRWLIETLFEEAKGEWHINTLPSRELEPIKVHFFFNFIAYNIVNIFKRSLTKKYMTVGIEVLRRDILHKSAVLSFNGKTVTFELNKKFEIRYNEQLASIDEFINKTVNKIELVDLTLA